jgi:hypothetical protein
LHRSSSAVVRPIPESVAVIQVFEAESGGGVDVRNRLRVVFVAGLPTNTARLIESPAL